MSLLPSLRMIILILIAWPDAMRAAASARQNIKAMITNWYELHPSPDIYWKPCFKNIICTVVEVLLDYEDTGVGTAAIAILKVPALNEATDTKDVLINPGVETAMSAEGVYHDIFGPAHNIICFDPRGVGHSTANLDPFHGNAALATKFFQQLRSTNPTTSASEFNAVFEWSDAHGDLSRQELGKDAAYVDTAAVAQDMLTIVKKLAVSNGKKASEAMLYYHGASYESMLGGAFVTLFQDRVCRIVVDAIGDGAAYYHRGLGLNALSDTDAAESIFFALCFEAGPERCAYHADPPETIKARYRKLLLEFKHNPIATDRGADSNTSNVCAPQNSISHGNIPAGTQIPGPCTAFG